MERIKEILDAPGFDPLSALEQQIKLLELQREQLDALILHARKIQKTGVMDMNFKPFDTSKMDQYAAEAKAKWGNTEAYKEYEKKTEKAQNSADALMALFGEIGKLRHLTPDAPEVQAAVAGIQAFITANYYNCTKQIFAGLGQMYIADDRFRQNIDQVGGEGTAEFVSRAIEIYCK